jgi:quercetin dioxygenase-like cupin family protein
MAVTASGDNPRKPAITAYGQGWRRTPHRQIRARDSRVPPRTHARARAARRHRAAGALQISVEELLAAPRAGGRLYPLKTLPMRTQGQGRVRKLLPDPVPGMEMDRIELPAGGRMPGSPHTPGTREYLTCETGHIVLAASGERWELGPGDVVAFRGDQRHSYANPGPGVAVGYSVVVLAHAL